MNKPRGVILSHDPEATIVGAAWDFFVSHETPETSRFAEGIYRVGCMVAKRWMASNPGWIHLGSEDNGHLHSNLGLLADFRALCASVEEEDNES